MNVPFLDVAWQNRQFDFSGTLRRVIEDNSLVLGPEVYGFEEEWAACCGVKHCVSVGNGFDALKLALLAHGVSKKDEVLVPVHTFIATWMAVSATGATPVPVDCDENGYIDLDAAGMALTHKTTAIVTTNLYGQQQKISEISEFVQRNVLRWIVDAAQSHGLKNQGGHTVAFSFYPTKNLGALGDGGAITTDDSAIAERVRMYRNYGSTYKNIHDRLGSNSRLDELQAAFLRQKLWYLNSWNEKRAANAALYLELLAGTPGLKVLSNATDSVWHQFVIRSNNRKLLGSRLWDDGIGTIVHYPTPPHLQSAYRELGYKAGSFPNAEKFAHECLSLPIGPELTVEQIKYVAEKVKEHGTS